MSSASGSPSKGKGKEEETWQLGWWALQPLLEPEDRPVVWSRSGTIFTAHSTQPCVLGRLFPSSKQFVLPAPEPIYTNSAAYEPPSVISVSPSASHDAQLLFAYFPSRIGSGVCCLWKAGDEIDTWVLREYWICSPGAGIVASVWLGQTREWATDISGNPIRLPPLGPSVSAAISTMLLITQDMQAKVYSIRPGSNAPSRVLSCSLTTPDVVKERDEVPNIGIASDEHGVKVCLKAAIGLGYNESSIIVATYSRLVQRPSKAFSFQEMDLGLPMDMPTHVESDEWDDWNDEPTVELCEVRLGLELRTSNLLLSTSPLPSLPCHSGHLSKLKFVPRNPSALKFEETNHCVMHLLTSYIDFNNDLSTPKSDIVVHSLSRNKNDQNNSLPPWLASEVLSRESGFTIPTFFSGRWSCSPADSILVGTIDTSTHIPKRRLKAKELSVGSVVVVQIPSLEVDEKWKARPLFLTSADNVLPDIPFNVAISPNGDLMCMVSSPQLSPLRISIRPLSRQDTDALFGSSPDNGSPSTLNKEAVRILTALRSGGSVSDVIHRLSLPSHPLSEVYDLLREVTLLLKPEDTGYDQRSMKDVVGLLLEVYRSRAIALDAANTEQEELGIRWRTAQDICSVIACHEAFEECKDGDRFDSQAVWPLVGLSTWFIDFLEGLMKECVLWSDRSTTSSILPVQSPASDDLFGAPSPANAPSATTLFPAIFLHFVHPFTLNNLRIAFTDVKSFYDQLVKENPRGESVQIAKSALLDTVACSGLNLDELETVFLQLPDEIKQCDEKELANSLSLCRPSQATCPLLDTVVRKIVDSKSIDKPRLFIKATDLVVGVAKLSVSDKQVKDNGHDIVSKGSLLRRGRGRLCQRCGGKSEVSDLPEMKHTSQRWRAWESRWATRCICGGYWVNRGLAGYNM